MNLILISAVLITLALLFWLLSFIRLPSSLETILKSKRSRKTKLEALNKRLEANSIPLSAETFTALHYFMMIVPIIIGIAIIKTNPIIGLVLIVSVFLIKKAPERFFDFCEKRRKENIEKEFSYMINQIRIYAKASDYYQALRIVPHALKGPLKKEMQLLSAEIELSGIQAALKNFSYRCQLKPATDFANTLSLALKTGADVDKILSTIAKTTHQRRVTKIKRWIKVQPILFTVLPGLMLMVFILMWIIPMYTNIITRLKIL